VSVVGMHVQAEGEQVKFSFSSPLPFILLKCYSLSSLLPSLARVSCLWVGSWKVESDKNDNGNTPTM